MSVICLLNQKGGVGKTTLALNVAASFALAGNRVLYVDPNLAGRPTFTPRSRAAARPARVRSGTIDRSNSAKLPSICISMRPAANDRAMRDFAKSADYGIVTKDDDFLVLGFRQ